MRSTLPSRRVASQELLERAYHVRERFLARASPRWAMRPGRIDGRCVPTASTATMIVNDRPAEPTREPVLDVVERVSEMLFGLFMALTFVGALSVADAGRMEVREMMIAAIGCNLAWGLVDAVMYLVRTVTTRGRWLTLLHSVRSAADTGAGRALVGASLSRSVADLFDEAGLEGIRGRIVALPSVPPRPRLERGDWLAALGVFLIVVVSTFPVVLPFMFFDDIGVAKTVSRGVALAMLFVGGMALGRHAGYGSWKVGLMMTGLGVVVVVAVIALGG
jgi:hypothetical protein